MHEPGHKSISTNATSGKREQQRDAQVVQPTRVRVVEQPYVVPINVRTSYVVSTTILVSRLDIPYSLRGHCDASQLQPHTAARLHFRATVPAAGPTCAFAPSALPSMNAAASAAVGAAAAPSAAPSVGLLERATDESLLQPGGRLTVRRRLE